MPYLRSRGWTPGEVEPLARRYADIMRTLERYAVIADVNPSLPTSGQMKLDPADHAAVAGVTA